MSAFVRVVCVHRGKETVVAEFGVSNGKVTRTVPAEKCAAVGKEAKRRIEEQGQVVYGDDGEPRLLIDPLAWQFIQHGFDKDPLVCRRCRKRVERTEALDALVRETAEADTRQVTTPLNLSEVIGKLGSLGS